MRISAKQLLCFELVFTVFMMQWMTYVGISNIKVLVPDVINIIIIIIGYKTLIKNLSDKPVKPAALAIMVFWCVTFLGSILGEMFSDGLKGIVLAMWDMRTFMRPFLYMLLCYSYLEKKDLDKIFEIAYKLQFVNILFSLYQYYVDHIWMDQNGGMFAPVQGCNSYSNVYCCLMMAWVLARYIRGKVKITRVVLTFGCCVLVAIYSELKFLFIELVVITLLSILFSGGKKIFRVLIMGVLILYFGMYLLMTLFPESFQFLTDSELFMWYARDMSYSQTEVSVNRLSGFDIINEYMFDNDFLRKLFGFGWGATGRIPFIGLYAPAALAYKSLSYNTFTYTWVYAELGVVGLLLLYSVFTVLFISVVRSCPAKSDAEGYGILSKTMIVMTIVLMVYDHCLIMEGPGFMCALGMVAVLIAQKGCSND